MKSSPSVLALASVLGCASVLAAAVACSSSPPAADTPPPATAAVSASAGVEPAPTSASTGADPEPAPTALPEAPKGNPTEQLVRDIVKTGRKIGFSATKRAVFHAVRWDQPGSGFGLRVSFQAEDGKELKSFVVCQPGECEEHLDDKLKTEIPKIAAYADEGGYEGVSGNGWAGGQSELELKSAGLKLSFVKGKLELVLEKGRKTLGTVPSKKGAELEPEAVYLLRDTKLVAVMFRRGGGTASAPRELMIFKLP